MILEDGLMTWTSKRKQFIQQRLEDKDYICCEVCGTSRGGFDVHHIMYRSEFPKHPLLHNPINLILVCRYCHDNLHAKKSNRDNIVAERNLTKHFKK